MWAYAHTCGHMHTPNLPLHTQIQFPRPRWPQLSLPGMSSKSQRLRGSQLSTTCFPHFHLKANVLCNFRRENVVSQCHLVERDRWANQSKEGLQICTPQTTFLEEDRGWGKEKEREDTKGGGGERRDKEGREGGDSEKLCLKEEYTDIPFPCTPFSWLSACLHIDTTLAWDLHSAPFMDAGQHFLLHDQSVGRLDAKSALKVFSRFYNHADSLRWHEGNWRIPGKWVEGNYSILK